MKHSARIGVAFLFSLALSSTVFADDASTLSGVARDATSRKAVADVVVTLSSPALKGAEQTEVTDPKGAYSFKGLAAGSYSLRFEGGAFRPLARTVVIEAGKKVTADVELLPESLVAEEMVVTGTRIPKLEVGAAAPVTTVNRAQIQASGRASVGEILQTLPEQTGGINTQVNNGGDGSTRINLRGMGTARTLVLLNGRRMVAGGTGADSTVDLNTIPAAAISRIEILKDGASAIYGSDAVTGVVNIITRQDYNGTELGAFTGLSQRGDGLVYDLSFTTGRVTDRGSLLFSGGYTGQRPVMAGARSFSKYDTGASSGGYDWPSGQLTAVGSGTTPAGRLGVPGDEPGNAEWQALRAKYPKARTFTRDESGEYRPFVGPAVTDAGGDTYNYQPENYLVTPQNRLSLFSTGTLRLFGTAQGYYEAIYTHRESDQMLAPEPLVGEAEGLTLSKDNVYNRFGVDFFAFRRRLVEFGNRRFAQDVDTFRLVTGVRGEFMPTWHWDLFVNYGRTQGVSTKEGLLQRSKLANAVGPSFIDDEGNAVCGTRDAPIADCVPINLMGGPGSITTGMRDYLTYKGTARGFNQQIVAGASTAAELVRIGNAASPLGVAAGFEHRRESGSFVPDPLTAQGDTTGNKGQETSGGYQVNEGFVELNLPLLGRFGNFAGAGNLFELSAAGRFVNYNTFGNNFSYKLGARVSPVQDFTLRATYSTAFRAPTISELYAGLSDDFPNAADPCAGRVNDGGPLDHACDEQGVPDDLADDQGGQVRTRVGGNTALKPETARSFTIGAAFQPRFAKDFELTVDYYNLDVRNTITSVGAPVILASCYPAQGGAPSYCDRIHRGKDGHIRSIDDPVSNVGGDAMGGIDLQVDYSPQTPIGRLGFTANINWLAFYTTTFGDGRVVNGRGVYDLSPTGTGGIYPAFKGNFGINYARNGLSGGLNIRWLGSFTECENNACAVTDPDAPAPRSRRVAPYAAADLNLGYRHSYENGSATTFALGVNNVLDTPPVYVANGFSAASDTSAYDYMGRYFYIRLAHEFK